MATKTKSIKLTRLADELEDLEWDFKVTEEEYQNKKDEVANKKAEIIKELDSLGFESVRTSSGMVFIKINGRRTYGIKKGFEAEGIKWAVENYPAILSVSAPKLAKVVQPMLTLPEFIEKKEGEPFLSVRTTEE